jgi:hypothetical protein
MIRYKENHAQNLDECPAIKNALPVGDKSLIEQGYLNLIHRSSSRWGMCVVFNWHAKLKL